MADADPARTPASGTGSATPLASPAAEAAVTRRPWLCWTLMLIVPVGLAIGALLYWQSIAGKVSTDSAYLKQDIVSVSAEVGGAITGVLVKDGDVVQAGQLLFRIDPEPFRLQINEANAAIASAQANVIALSNASQLTGTDIEAASSDVAFAEARFERVRALRERGFSTKAEYEAAEQQVLQAREGVRQAQDRQREARARLASGPAVPGVNPQIAVAEARRANAQLSLRRTEVRAPAAGRIAQAERLQVGQQAVPNLPVLTLVRENSTYVEANFKETDLADMAVGQRAEIRFDAYPDVVLKGRVATIGAGTGSEFSVLPAQNATGNWVKVTQRVPLRIAIDGQSSRRLIAGLSSEVTVFTDRAAKR
ncbi:HlyD family secretion protein [Erythrobacter sp. WG]|uniref:HlyD family secretion protein n=1 Tax=Erythrobacter sp. WG TaxID=2985510 RepID=UPI00226F2001|nr:HlyD family secretion protein [Erythrobacter sp. WG]MCX9146743.1 HlyD family secretion protein [Erythrobacter sp. WG]